MSDDFSVMGLAVMKLNVMPHEITQYPNGTSTCQERVNTNISSTRLILYCIWLGLLYVISLSEYKVMLLFERQVPLSAGQVGASRGARGTVCDSYCISSQAHHTVWGTIQNVVYFYIYGASVMTICVNGRSAAYWTLLGEGLKRKWSWEMICEHLQSHIF